MKLILSLFLLFTISFLFVSSSPAFDNKIVITSNNETIKIDASNKSVIVEGSNNTIYLLGECTDLTIKGNGNIIEVTTSVPVANRGSNNIITKNSDAVKTAEEVPTVE